MLVVEQYLNLVLFFVALGLSVFALVDAVVRPSDAYTAHDKMTKPAWLLILTLATLIILLSQSAMGLLGLFAVVASGVYLADVRPTLR